MHLIYNSFRSLGSRVTAKARVLFTGIPLVPYFLDEAKGIVTY